MILKKFGFMLIVLMVVACSERQTAVSMPTSPPELPTISPIAITEIEFGNDGKAQISINTIPATPDGGGVELGGAALLEFERVNGEWVVTVLGVMVS